MSADRKSLYCNRDTYAKKIGTAGLSTTTFKTLEWFSKWESQVGACFEFQKNNWGGDYGILLRYRNNGSSQFVFAYIESDGTVRARYINSDYSALGLFNTWRHHVALFDTDNKFYLYEGVPGDTFPTDYTDLSSGGWARNGTSTGFLALKNASYTTRANLGTTFNSGTSDTIDGYLVDVRIFSTRVSNADLTTYNDEFRPESAPTGGLTYWKLNESSGTANAVDFWGSADDLAFTVGSNGAVGAADSPFPDIAGVMPMAMNYYRRRRI